MKIIIFAIVMATAATLPAGHDQAAWGITAQQLKKIVSAVKVEPGENYHFAEHMEIEPDVYVLKEKGKNRKIEYYFYKAKLYKIFIVYDRQPELRKLYNHLKQSLVSHFGRAEQEFKRTVFGLVVTHTQWDDGKTLLDLREGAGFVYQVRIDKAALKLKEKAYTLKKAI